MVNIFSSVKQIARRLVFICIKPKHATEDVARREFILNIFLCASIILLSFALVVNIRNSIILGTEHQGYSPLYVGAIFLFFVALLIFSRLGFYKIISRIFIFFYLAIIVHGIYTFGADEPQSLLGFAMLIVMAGVLVDSRFAFFLTILSSLSIIVISYVQMNQWYVVKAYWKNEALAAENPIITSMTLGIIAIVAWLSNREIEKSLARARRSETELKKERDSLEITVEARTRELKETQAEKMTQLYRFAEFGRLSSGLFHDLINPLTAVSLNIEKVKNAGETKQYVDKAIVAARKMEDMVSAVRKQLSRQETKTLFSVSAEAAQAIEVLSHKAMKAKVNIRFLADNEIKTYGDAIKFNQIALNLIINAIDAYNIAGEVVVSLNKKNGLVIFEVKDKGIGISEENKPKLFEPFFTTKEEGYGLGIGLSIIKRIVEKDFGGNIEVTSKEGEGSTFTVKFPQKDKEFS